MMMKHVVAALLVVLGLSLNVTSAKAEATMCHEIYSHAAGRLVVIDTASRGAYHNSLRLYDEMPDWKLSEHAGLWHAQLCLSKTVWQKWNSQYAASGMSMCVHEAGVGVYCKTFLGKEHAAFTCDVQRYIYHPPHQRHHSHRQAPPRVEHKAPPRELGRFIDARI